MSVTWLANKGLTIVVAVVLISLLLSGVLGSPVLLSYVETDSMEPTLNPGDGFVALPNALTGDIQSGDVVVYEAEKVQGGGLTTHRVVQETQQGYITRGDANPFTDQGAGEPPVKEAQIVAEALQIGGHVVSIPYLGTVVGAIQGILVGLQRQLAILLGSRSLLGVQGLAYLILGFSAVAYTVDYLLTGSESDRSIERSRNRDTGTSSRLVVAGLGLLVVLGAMGAMIGPAGSQEIGILSAEFESDNPTIIPQGEAKSLEYSVPNSGLIPVYSYLEPGSEGVEIQPREVRVAGGATATATLTLSAPPETGYYRRYVVEHRYLALLPQSHVRALYGIHPWLPLVAIGLLLWVPFYVVGTRLVGSGRIRRRTRDGPGTVDRLLARLR